MAAPSSGCGGEGGRPEGPEAQAAWGAHKLGRMAAFLCGPSRPRRTLATAPPRPLVPDWTAGNLGTKREMSSESKKQDTA